MQTTKRFICILLAFVSLRVVFAAKDSHTTWRALRRVLFGDEKEHKCMWKKANSWKGEWPLNLPAGSRRLPEHNHCPGTGKPWKRAATSGRIRSAASGTRVPALVCLFAAILAQGYIGCQRRAPEYEIVTPSGESLELKLSGDSLPPVHFFTYKSKGRNVNFFVRKDRDGAMHTHFDACYSCFKYKMGYVVEGNRVVCRACRLEFDLSEPIWDFIGSCVPITLSSKASPGSVVIKKQSLERGEQFF